METIILIVVLLAILLLSNALGYLATLKPWPNVKPFNCRECLTFWITLIAGGLFAWMHNDPGTRAVFFYIAVLSAFLNYFYITSKIKVYE